MTKRQCPFEDDYVPQTKVHLTKKSYERTNVKAMENIWNKTRDLLFEAARRSVPGEKEVAPAKSEQCDFCQNYFKSLNDCSACHGCYCSNCSLITYKETLTEFICLSCA